MLLGAAVEAGRISDRAQRCSTTLHVATNTTSAAIDDIATARQHGSAAPPLPPHHRRQAATSRAPERRTGGSRRSRSGQVGLGKSISRRLIDPCGAESKRARPAGPCGAIGRARGSIGLDPVAEQHHLISRKRNSPPPAIAPLISRARE
jgi:hypothetical protein